MEARSEFKDAFTEALAGCQAVKRDNVAATSAACVTAVVAVN
jgi:hypothetical protein